MSGLAPARGLFAIGDPAHCGTRDVVTLAEAILAGGCAVLQFRAKSLSDRERLDLCLALRARTSAHGVLFVVNDRPDLALLSGADGLHLGQDDLPIDRARRIVGTMPISLSTHDLAQARAAQERGADAIGFGPVFPTRSKERPDPIVGTEGLEAVVRSVSIPVIAIGGIDRERIDAVRATGAPLAAVIGALADASDPEREARSLHQAMQPR